MEINFSRYHPLDHWPGTKRCRAHYGGWRNHLVMTWRFRRSEQVIGWFWKPLLCPLGIHRISIWCKTVDPVDLFKASADDKYTAICRCGYSRPATREEIAERWKVEI